MHLSQFVFQRNDAVKDDDEDDARDKYVARQLFRRLASKGQLSSQSEAGDASDTTTSPFRLFCEDLRPSNVLIDKDLRVVGVIDWEFVYAAPPQFSSDPLETFLRALEGVEEKTRTGDETASGLATPSLSQRMRKSWESKNWMINYAARSSWAFDFVYWRYLDERFFGPNEDKDHRARLALLTQKERETMERLVEMKMEQQREANLVTLDHDSAAAQLARFMI
ncbi:Protein kinase-like domain [Apiospora kogelbergensis]|uniref:Protein kinase-like domain n=1 Tax=Apiospora kogelbergensis TaxID=1337665 RepID=A0AAW0Q3P1_9PEZI